MGLARVASLAAGPRARLVAAALLLLAPARRADGDAPGTTELVAARDAADLDGIPDGDEAAPSRSALVDAVPLGDLAGALVVAESGGEHARLVVPGRALPWGSRVPSGVLVQGRSAGTVVVRVDSAGVSRSLRLVVSSLGFRDGAGQSVDATRSHASLDRSPPSEVPTDRSAAYAAPDPLRVFVVSPTGSLPAVGLESVDAVGAHVDGLADPVLLPVPCGEVAGDYHCFASDPIRFVIDEVDRRHVVAAQRSVRAELGGAIVLRLAGRKEQALRVLGPRESPVGPIGRLRATVRPFVVRLSRGGGPAVGGDDAGAIAAVRAELAAASAVWAECGVTFGPPGDTAVRIVDPPPSHILSLGDDLGLPASGGHVRFRADGHPIDVEVAHGALPIEAAHVAARAISGVGLVAVVSSNARVASAASASADVSVRRPGGTLATLELPATGARVTDDPTLAARIGVVDLSDGLAHFGDVDSVAGTLEERTLLKAFDDGDPRTIEIVVVPSFTGGGRIGESFIGTDRSSLRDVVILDRAGVRARRSSQTLAHELGHVLLDVPGHPDDFGVDTPTRLMDADAADASPFGPRRLTLAECARVVRESGPSARVPLLREWPLAPLTYARR